MLKYLNQYAIPFKVVATKCDKIKKSEYAKNKQIVAHSLGLGESDIILTSSEKRFGLNEILKTIDEFLV